MVPNKCYHVIVQSPSWLAWEARGWKRVCLSHVTETETEACWPHLLLKTSAKKILAAASRPGRITLLVWDTMNQPARETNTLAATVADIS